ncbi:hypothetical protein ACFPVY_02775 [Flavobacterium qiangtangense]|uniref:Uncharacterized protein n=1 Tax=Flavobacterium qiangtangense TaxID=1442595 RepID=A0ABW1PL95_9FLAO
MVYSEFCQKLKEDSLDRELDMYNYGLSCGLLCCINLNGVRVAFEGHKFTKAEVASFVSKIVSGYCKGAKA